MSKVCSVYRNKKREDLVKKYANKRAALKAIINDKNSTQEQIFEANLKLAKLPRNSSAVRVKRRCELTGRPRGNYRRFKLSRIKIRELASEGQIPGATKSSW